MPTVEIRGIVESHSISKPFHSGWTPTTEKKMAICDAPIKTQLDETPTSKYKSLSHTTAVPQHVTYVVETPGVCKNDCDVSYEGWDFSDIVAFEKLVEMGVFNKFGHLD
jgi:hypothetical protein